MRCQCDIPVDADRGAQAEVVVVRSLPCEVAGAPPLHIALLGRKSLFVATHWGGCSALLSICVRYLEFCVGDSSTFLPLH